MLGNAKPYVVVIDGPDGTTEIARFSVCRLIEAIGKVRRIESREDIGLRARRASIFDQAGHLVWRRQLRGLALRERVMRQNASRILASLRSS